MSVWVPLQGKAARRHLCAGASAGPESPAQRRRSERRWQRRIVHSAGQALVLLIARKLFVGGLDWSTTQETLRSYFSQYGEVVDCVIMKDKTTNQSRGFGFVKFKDPNCVGTVLASRPHTLDGRNVTEVVMIYDAEKQRPRAKTCSVSHSPCRVLVVEVKRAEPRDSKSQAPGQPGASQWGSRVVPSAANGWAGQPPPTWQQGYGPQGMWVPAGQAIGGYGPPPAGRGAPPPPPPFTSYIVSTPPGGFPPPQGFPQGYGAPPQFRYGQDLAGFGQGFSDPSQQPPSYGGPSVPGSGGPPAGGSGFGRGQNHNVQGFHPYRR
ncbi:hypothetical protein CB1_000215003 [Camelus ferus]|nr:hypothetical protein CB1_000215003 [Camelus ferus]